MMDSNEGNTIGTDSTGGATAPVASSNAGMPTDTTASASAGIPVSAPDSAYAGMPAGAPTAGAPAAPVSYDFVTFPRQFLSYRWFKPLLVTALGFVFIIVFSMFLYLIALMISGDINFIANLGTSYETMNPFTAPGAIVELGSIAIMIPALALAALIVRDRPFSSYSSSRGGWNWGAFFKCLAVAVALYAVATTIQMLFFPPTTGDGVNRFTIAGLILFLALVPLQCLAEEYVFRGLFLQTVGAWTKLPVVAIIVSALVFAAGHPYNVIGAITIFFNGVIWGFVAWKTKGIEATGALHIVNNFIAFGFAGLGIEAATSEIDIPSMIVALVIDLVFAVAVIWLGKKYNWFSSKGDGTAQHNERVRAKQALKQQRKAAAQGGYAVAPAAVQGGYVAPGAGYAPPQAGYAPPQAGYAAPQAGYAPPTAGNVAPGAGYVPPQAGYAMPQANQVPPQAGYAMPQANQVPPQAGMPAAQGGYVVAPAEQSGQVIPPVGYAATPTANPQPPFGYQSDPSVPAPYGADRQMPAETANHQVNR